MCGALCVRTCFYVQDGRCAFVDFVDAECAVAAYHGMYQQRLGGGVVELGFGIIE